MLIPIVLLLVLLLIFGFGGFLLGPILWIVLAVLVVLWLLGFMLRSGSGRWYRW